MTRLDGFIISSNESSGSEATDVTRPTLPSVKDCGPDPSVDCSEGVERPDIDHWCTAGNYVSKPDDHVEIRQKIHDGEEDTCWFLHTKHPSPFLTKYPIKVKIYVQKHFKIRFYVVLQPPHPHQPTILYLFDILEKHSKLRDFFSGTTLSKWCLVNGHFP